MEYHADNQQLINSTGKSQEEDQLKQEHKKSETKSEKKLLWWKVLVFSAFAILAVAMLALIINIRISQNDENLVITNQIPTDYVPFSKKLADFQVKLQDALVEQIKIAKRKSEEQLEKITKELEVMYKSISAHDCRHLFDNGKTQDGIYTIYADNKPINVWCDMSTGGAIVLMRRYDGSLNFSRTFQQYSDGFGDLADEHWLGLTDVHRITQSGNWTLRIDLESFDNDTAYSEYTGFRVDCGTSFTLQFDRSSFKGTAGDNLDYFHGMKFSALDKDQDEWESGSCSRKYGKYGGWWFKRCQHGLFTGMPYRGNNSIYWKAWKGKEVLKAVTMKIRRN